MTNLSTLQDDLAFALRYDAPSRWAIGDTMRAIRAMAGEEAMLAAVPDDAKAARLARRCLQVADRWPEPAERRDGLEWGHYARVLWLDDAGATVALDAAEEGGWTPAQMGRWLAGLSPDEPAVAVMAAQLAELDAQGRLTFVHSGDGQWSVQGPAVTATLQPSVGAAVKAAWRKRFGGAA